MNAFFVLFCFVFFVFLKKNKELSEMLLEGNRVTEIKPGKDNIILYKKKKCKIPHNGFASKWVINPPIVREREFAAQKRDPVRGTLGQLLTVPLTSTLLKGKCLLKVLVNKATRVKANC